MRTFLLLLMTLSGYATASAQALFHEPFDYVEFLFGEDINSWRSINVSSPLGTPSEYSWFQADMSMGIHAHMGPEEHCYIQADRYATSAATGGTISNWLISPVLYLFNGDSVRFHAISHNNLERPDKIEVRVSTLGAESIMPTSATDVGSFNYLIGVINPDMTTTGFPSVANGDAWKLYRFPVAGFPNGGECRVAIRYIVNNAGSSGPNGSAVGIDEFYIVGPDGYIGTEKTINHQLLHCYPNPAASHIAMTASLQQVRILSVDGQVQFIRERVQSNETIDVTHLAPGIYTIVGHKDDDTPVVMRFIKQ
ncbi:MAG TPA: choice-of-anchor J domain-containing protein [Flavobacteriales bacterium]